MIEPFYPTGKRGRSPIGIERMLRMYLLQLFYHSSDPGTEEAICDSYALRKFMKLDFVKGQVPDETTLCKFRHVIEGHDLHERFFQKLNEFLTERGLTWRGGTLLDATIIAATASTENKKKERGPEMHQTKKQNQ